jgi:hypothetical protein
MSIFGKEPIEIDGPNRFLGHEARLREDGGFSFDSPAANGIFTYERWKGGMEPQPISCSNMDGPLRQILMLAALAEYHNLLSEDLDPPPH